MPEARQSRRTKVAVLINLLPGKLGSMENWLNQFTSRLAEDYTVSVATYGPCHSDVRAQFERVGVRWYDLSRIESSLQSARSWLREHADIIHFSLFAPRSPAVLAAATLGSSRVVFQDCLSTPTDAGAQAFASRLLDRVTFARTARVVAVSGFVEKRIQERFGVCGARLQMVYNGVDVERFRVLSSSSVGAYTICVAALIPAKGVDHLIRAFAEPALIGERLIICGDGPERASLEALASDCGVAPHVDFLGMRDDVHRLVGDSALFVHPAVWGEAFGLTIAEAMAAGRPVVGCNVGAVPELIEDGITGLIVPPFDTGALADAISSLLQDPERRDAMGSAGRRRVKEHFAMNDWVEGHLRIIAELARPQ